MTVLTQKSFEKKLVTRQNIHETLNKLGLAGQKVVIHASLSSFGWISGGVEALVTEITRSFETVLVPTFCHEYMVPAPPDDRPKQNGIDYSLYDNWEKPLMIYHPKAAKIDPRMGRVSLTLSRLPGTMRSQHPYTSWTAYGNLAGRLVYDHSWEAPYLPLERLAEMGGQLVLMGVELSSCSALHIAHERAGYPPLLRWAMDTKSRVRRMRVFGCAGGFNNLLPYFDPLFSVVEVGNCKIQTMPLKPFIQRAISIIRANPELVRCSAECVRCRDTLLGGPKV